MPSQDPSSQIERVPLHEEVTNRLRDMIVSLRLPPGERIQELEVAQLLGVSRTPVREAIKVLTAEGLVELLPLRGAIVKAFSAKDARDMLEVIALLETHAGERACLADPVRIDAILQMHQEMKVMFEAQERLAYFALNQRIHEALIALADNDTLSTTLTTKGDNGAIALCERALRVANNVAIEASACGTKIAGAAATITANIAAKVAGR